MKRKTPRVEDGIDPKVLASYNRWVAKHLDEMVRKHSGKFIAVYRNKLIAVGDSYSQVYQEAQTQELQEPPLSMQVPSVEDLEAIL
jgi:hypothetical protein